jgi:hypothetical protein
MSLTRDARPELVIPSIVTHRRLIDVDVPDGEWLDGLLNGDGLRRVLGAIDPLVRGLQIAGYRVPELVLARDPAELLSLGLGTMELVNWTRTATGTDDSAWQWHTGTAWPARGELIAGLRIEPRRWFGGLYLLQGMVTPIIHPRLAALDEHGLGWVDLSGDGITDIDSLTEHIRVVLEQEDELRAAVVEAISSNWTPMAFSTFFEGEWIADGGRGELYAELGQLLAPTDEASRRTLIEEETAVAEIGVTGQTVRTRLEASGVERETWRRAQRAFVKSALVADASLALRSRDLKKLTLTDAVLYTDAQGDLQSSRTAIEERLYGGCQYSRSALALHPTPMDSQRALDVRANLYGSFRGFYAEFPGQQSADDSEGFASDEEQSAYEDAKRRAEENLERVAVLLEEPVGSWLTLLPTRLLTSTTADDAVTVIRSFLAQGLTRSDAEFEQIALAVGCAIADNNVFWKLIEEVEKIGPSRWAERFLEGLQEALGLALSEDPPADFVREIEALLDKHTAAMPVLMFLPFVQALGAIHGALEHVWKMLVGFGTFLLHPIEELTKLVDGITKLLTTLLEQPDEFAYLMGKAAGELIHSHTSRLLATSNPFAYAYELGRMLGPLLLDIVVSIIFAAYIAPRLMGLAATALKAAVRPFLGHVDEIVEIAVRYEPDIDFDAPSPIVPVVLLSRFRPIFESAWGKALADALLDGDQGSALLEAARRIQDLGKIDDAALEAILKRYKSSESNAKQLALIGRLDIEDAGRKAQLETDLAAICKSPSKFENGLYATVAKHFDSYIELWDGTLPIGRTSYRRKFEEAFEDDPEVIAVRKARVAGARALSHYDRWDGTSPLSGIADRFGTWKWRGADGVETDRPGGIEGWVERKPQGAARAKDAAAIQREVTTAIERPGDWHGGHLFADLFYGPDVFDNIVAVSRSMNLSEMKTIENAIGRLLIDEGGPFYLRVEVLDYTAEGIATRIRYTAWRRGPGDAPEPIWAQPIELHDPWPFDAPD